MASKFNAKNLHYEKQEPAFLRRLRGQALGDSDRHSIQTARPGKKSRLEMDDDDGPTIVYGDEAGGHDGESVGREEYEVLTKTRDSGGAQGQGNVPSGVGGQDGGRKDGEAAGSPNGRTAGQEREKQKVADVGGMKKRKAGKVVAGEDDDDAEVVEPGTKVGAGARPPAESAKEEVNSKSKPAGKKKKVKLSFDDPDS